jgi:multiple sugar transport system substrate-binding protein
MKFIPPRLCAPTTVGSRLTILSKLVLPSSATMLAVLCSPFVGLGALHAEDQFKQPDLSKFQVEPGPINLEVWIWSSGFDKVVSLFEAAYPNIKIKVGNYGNDTYPKARTAFKAGTGAPDVLQVEYMMLPSFIATAGLRELSDLGGGSLQSYYVPWAWRQVSPDGKSVYSVPGDSGPLGLMYNKKIFDQYKIEVPKTWDEYAAAAEKLYKASNGKVKIGNFTATNGDWFSGLVWAAGGRFFDVKGDSVKQSLNSPVVEKVLTFWANLIKKGYVSTYATLTPDFWNALGRGEVASGVEAVWGTGFYSAFLAAEKGDWRVAPLPQWEANKPVVSGNWGGSSYAVTTQSKYPKAAALFCYWLNTNRQAISIYWETQSIFPTDKFANAIPELHKLDQKPADFFGGQDVFAEYSKISDGVSPDWTWVPWWNYTSDAFAKRVAALISGNATPKQVLDDWQQDSIEHAKNEGFDVRN